MPFRVAILGIYHESNTFIRFTTSINDFRNNTWLVGNKIINAFTDTHHEIGGMVDVLSNEHVEVIPVFFATATPGGTIEAAAADTLLQEMFNALEAALPIDACLVIPHGAAVAENYPDFDGYWLSQLRKKVGNNIPVVGTLDPHANISREMAASTNALIAYKTNPHIDQRETGERAAIILIDILKGKISPHQYLLQLPMAISIEQQQTDKDPCRSLLDYIHAQEKMAGIISASLLLGFVYADVDEMGTSLLVIANNITTARKTAERIADYILTDVESFNGVKLKFKDIKEELFHLDKPILLLDMGDNIGGGSNGDSTWLLKELAQVEAVKYFFCIYDRAAVLTASRYETGDKFTMNFVEDDTEQQFAQEVELVKIADGKFTENDARHGGLKLFNMGKTAILKTGNESIIMATSERVLPFSLQQLLAFDIDPEKFDVIVAKGVNAPIAAYGKVCRTILKIDTPGVTQADMTAFKYKNRRKPMFPFESINKAGCNGKLVNMI